MKVRIALLILVGALAACVARPYTFERLVFGMTQDEASAALGVPLTYVSGRPGSEIYVADQPARIPGAFYPSEERLFLQFRQGRLSGWKGDWEINKPFHR